MPTKIVNLMLIHGFITGFVLDFLFDLTRMPSENRWKRKHLLACYVSQEGQTLKFKL